MGTYIVNGKCTAEITHTGMNTEFGKIAGMISSATKALPLQIKVNKIAQYMIVVALVMATIVGILMVAETPTLDWPRTVEILLVVIALAIAAFPEGFPVVLITVLATGARRMASKNAIVNRMSIIETLGETSVICSDKTGTITTGKMTVTKILCNQRKYDVTGAGYVKDGAFLCEGREIDPKGELRRLFTASMLCNDARITLTGDASEYTVLGSATEGALLIASAKAGIFLEDTRDKRIEEIPFNSERKMMSVVCKGSEENILYVKGAPEVILARCTALEIDGKQKPLTAAAQQKIHETTLMWTQQSYRTLAIAYRVLPVRGSVVKDAEQSDLIFLGLYGLSDPPRDEVAESIRQCEHAGIAVKMITGDNKETAVAIAGQIGLGSRCLDGTAIDTLTDAELAVRVKDVSIFARVRPEHKLRIVRALRSNGEIVAMTGDGVNDAPALKEAHIGVAMGKNGTDVTREVADLILKDDHFSTIVDAIREGRTIFSNIQKFAAYQISINCAQLAIVFFAILFKMPLPLLALQILFMNLVSDEILAIMLAFNPYSKDAMDVKPRKNSAIITRTILIPLLIAAVTMSVSSLVMYAFALAAGAPLEVARTIVFTTMNMLAIANALQFRSFRKLTLTRTPFTNKYLVYGIVLAFVFTIIAVYSPLHTILGFTTILPQTWIIGIVAALALITIMDGYKLVRKKYFVEHHHD